MDNLSLKFHAGLEILNGNDSCPPQTQEADFPRAISQESNEACVVRCRTAPSVCFEAAAPADTGLALQEWRCERSARVFGVEIRFVGL